MNEDEPALEIEIENPESVTIGLDGEPILEFTAEEAEEEFIKANKPKEAIDMYVHQTDWANALRVAETYDATAVADVYIAQARVKADNGDWKGAEELYLAASRPELALVMFSAACSARVMVKLFRAVAAA
jgi:hypothetical protein